ncbi:MAG: S41 family peptidase [Bacteroidota bacterium]
MPRFVTSVMRATAACALCAVLLIAPALAQDAVLASASFATPPPTSSRTAFLTAEQQRADLDVLRSALTQLHPGLYRYHTEASLDQAMDQLAAAWATSETLGDAYLALSQFLATIKCGHTYANFWNQSDELQAELFAPVRTLPFAFRLIGERMVVTWSVDEAAGLPVGTEVTAIDGHAVPELIETLKAYVKADGSNDGKRIDNLQVTGFGMFEAFDVYFPLRFPATDGQYTLSVKRPGATDTETVSVEAITRTERGERYSAQHGEAATTYDDLWQFELLGDGAAYLQIGTFVTWRLEMDWKAFLRDAFTQLREHNVEHLVIDLRGNEGGDNDVNNMLMMALASQPLHLAPVEQRAQYDVMPEALRPHVTLWNEALLDVRNMVEDTGNGYFRLRGGSEAGRTLRANPDAYAGSVYLLVGASNSSATFALTTALQDAGVATVIGQETGGNKRGINGGQYVNLHLPNAGIEVDIPLIAYFPVGEMPADEGLMPDIVVQQQVTDVIEAHDPERAAAMALIAKARGE